MIGLWPTTFPDDGGGWVCECRVPNQMRRLLLVVVDTSDSMSEYRSDIRRVLTTIADALAPRDRCIVWNGASAEVLADVTVHDSNDRNMIPQVVDAWRESEGGTWLLDSVSSALDVSRQHAGTPDMQPFHLVISDGEVFDAEAIPSGAFSYIAVGPRNRDRLSPRMSSVSAMSIPEHLTCRPLAVSVSWAPDQARVWTLSDRGRLAGEVSPPLAAPEDGWVRLLFIGDSEPVVEVSYGPTSGRERITIGASRPASKWPELHHPDSRAEFVFDWARLTMLVDLAAAKYPAASGSVTCTCGRICFLSSHLECTSCTRSLLERKRRRVPAGYDMLREVEVVGRGIYGPDVATESRPRPHRFEVQRRGERTFLVLNLRP
jgi:hypothetical protein